MKLKSSRSAAGNAQVLLPKLAQKYFKAGRKAADGKRSPKQLHGFRLITKQFRYSLELFRPVYGPSMDLRLAALRGLQHVLGKLSDYRSARELLGSDKSLDSKIEHAMNEQLKEFHKEWMKFDTEGELKRWKAYLARSR